MLVVGHVIEGLTHMGLIHPHSFLAGMQNWFFTYRMPCFFLASGAVLSLHPLPSFGNFLRQRLLTVAYPHFLWGAFYLVVAIVFVRYYNTPIQNPENIGRHLVEIAAGQKSWFLVSLFAISLAAYVLIRSDVRLAVAAALLLCLLPINSHWTVITRSADYAIFFVIGYLGFDLLHRFSQAMPSYAHVTIGVLALALSLAMQALITAPASPYVAGLWSSIVSLVGVCGAWFLSMVIAKTTYLKRGLAALGLASLAIFLMHPMAIGASRVVLLPLLRDAPAIVPTALIALIGLALPTIAFYLLRSWGLMSPVFILRLAPTPASIGASDVRSR